MADPTIRERIADALRVQTLDAFAISGEVGVAVRDVPEHLQHLQRSLPHRGERLVVEPAWCRKCGHEFEIDRLTRPGRCPSCRAERIAPPRFSIAAA